jgi:hypothetical protein
MHGRVGAIEVVRDDLTAERSEEILDFLSERGGLAAQDARELLATVVCVVVDDAGEVIGLDSAWEDTIPLVRRRFWVYRQFLADGSSQLDAGLFNAAFEALGDGFDETGPGPIGVAVVLDDPAAIAQQPEPVWPETELMFAGYLPDGRQLRIRYFWGAAVGPGLPDSPTLDETRDRDWTLQTDYRVERLAESAKVSADDVLAFWAREKAVKEQEALRRVHEVELVAFTENDGVVGVASAYLGRSPALRMDLWHYRTYVAAAHRQSNLAAQLIFGTRDRLEGRFVSGEDTRAGGMIFELENEGLKRHRNKAIWLHAGFTFIGENKRGDHVRVHYFPGAKVPPPDPA